MTVEITDDGFSGSVRASRREDFLSLQTLTDAQFSSLTDEQFATLRHKPPKTFGSATIQPAGPGSVSIEAIG